MNWEFEQISYLFLLLLLPLLIWRIWYIYNWKKTKINQFAEASLIERIFGNINLSKFLKDNILMAAVVFLIILALANVLGNIEKKEVHREGMDMVFVIDVSKSMNAEDTVPSRMEKAKKIVSDVIMKLGGDRVGIVIFAGQAYSVMPLSNDYGAAELYLSGIDTNIISSQGTNIADAVTEASNTLSNIEDTSKAIILLSDGEAHEGNINKATETAKKNNISIYTIGIGSKQGAPIPITYNNSNYSEYKKDSNGDIVITHLDDSSLKKLAQNTGGNYFSGNEDSERVTQHIFDSLSELHRNKQSTSYIYDAKPYFQYFIVLALTLLIIVSLTNYKKDFNV